MIPIRTDRASPIGAGSWDHGPEPLRLGRVTVNDGHTRSGAADNVRDLSQSGLDSSAIPTAMIEGPIDGSLPIPLHDQIPPGSPTDASYIRLSRGCIVFIG